MRDQHYRHPVKAHKELKGSESQIAGKGAHLMDPMNNFNDLLSEKIMKEILHSGPARYRQAHQRTDPDAQWKAELSAQDTGQEPEDIFSVIGRKCVALGLDFASRIFAWSLVKAMAGEIGQVPPGSHTADPLGHWDLLAATWQSAWESDQAAILEQVIALGIGARPVTMPNMNEVNETAIENLGTEDHTHNQQSAPPYPDELTTREVEVLRLLSTGLSNAELACRLYLSRRTVHAHLRSIYTKIGVNTRAAATRYAVLHGLAA